MRLGKFKARKGYRQRTVHEAVQHVTGSGDRGYNKVPRSRLAQLVRQRRSFKIGREGLRKQVRNVRNYTPVRNVPKEKFVTSRKKFANVP